MTILFIIQYWSIAPVGFPIRKSTNQWIFAPPRGLSQLVTSFFGSWCQGIRRMLFLAWPRHNSHFLLRSAFAQLRIFVRLLLFPKNLPFFGIPNLLVSVFLVLNDLSFSLSFHYVSKSCKVFRYQYVFQHFSYPFLFEKTFIFFLLTSSSLFSFQTTSLR